MVNKRGFLAGVQCNVLLFVRLINSDLIFNCADELITKTICKRNFLEKMNFFSFFLSR